MPASILGNEYFRFDEAARALIGETTSETYKQGQLIELKLAEANPASGALSVRASRRQVRRRRAAARSHPAARTPARSPGQYSTPGETALTEPALVQVIEAA